MGKVLDNNANYGNCTDLQTSFDPWVPGCETKFYKHNDKFIGHHQQINKQT